MAFPSLFPYGTGDPFGVYKESSKKTRLQKIQHLLRYCELINGVLVSRFAEHPRFVLWVHNLVVRHRMLQEGDVYLQQNPGDANLTSEAIQDMLNNNDNQGLINRMRLYMANVPGTGPYWHKCNSELKAIIDQKGPPHLFFTFSFADR